MNTVLVQPHFLYTHRSLYSGILYASFSRGFIGNTWEMLAATSVLLFVPLFSYRCSTKTSTLLYKDVNPTNHLQLRLIETKIISIKHWRLLKILSTSQMVICPPNLFKREFYVKVTNLVWEILMVTGISRVIGNSSFTTSHHIVGNAVNYFGGNSMDCFVFYKDAAILTVAAWCDDNEERSWDGDGVYW